MKLSIIEFNSFRRDMRKIMKSGKNIKVLEEIVVKLANKEALPAKNRDHSLVGNWSGHRECHIEPNWLLIYKINENELLLVRTGSHANLFG
ncbi:MAG: type II toxin-antitoxin system YafQ family toxin [Pseudomonadota bacterium]